MAPIILDSPCGRRYSSEFKAQIVAAYRQAGGSVAALARRHAINSSTLRRWLREAGPSGAEVLPSPSTQPAPTAAAFVPVQIGAPLQERIHLELVRNHLTLRVDGPASHVPSWMPTVLAWLQ